MKDNLLTNFCIADTFSLRVGYIFCFLKENGTSVHTHTKKTFCLERLNIYETTTFVENGERSIKSFFLNIHTKAFYSMLFFYSVNACLALLLQMHV